MSIKFKRLLFCCIGFLSAFVAWPLSEIILYKQGSFNSYLMFSLIQGAMFGIIPGIFFGAIDGLLSKNRYKLKIGIIIGGAAGFLGGGIGGIISQKVLFLLQDSDYLIMFSRIVGLAILGIFVGMTDGLISKSLKKTIIGILGGIIGGITGGFVMVYLSGLYPGLIITRLMGIMFFTTLIGVFYSLIEKRLSRGMLLVLNGNMKSREFNIGQRVLKIGNSDICDVVLSNYLDIDDHHITITETKGKLSITKMESNSKMIINDEDKDNHILKYEDVIKLGSAKLYFKSR